MIRLDCGSVEGVSYVFCYTPAALPALCRLVLEIAGQLEGRQDSTVQPPVSGDQRASAGGHWLAATPTAHWLEYVDWAEPVLELPLAVQTGVVMPADRPGIGVSFNQVAVERFKAAC